MDPTNVVEKLRKDFDELIASKKWQERKEAVDGMISIMESAPRVEMSPELLLVMGTLAKVLEKDVNINVSSSCAKVLAKLAVSMRTDFAPMVPKVMPVAFDKLKEKKAVLRNELVELCDAAATTTSLENYTEAVCGGLTKPNPQSRAQTALFVARLLSRHDSTTVPVPAIKQITPDLVKCSSDADAEVRESTFRAMGAILRCLGEQAARRLFGELSEDKIKMGKITENFEKIREEFGDKAAPEIIRLHGAEAKPKCSSDADAEVRESTFRAMGAILRCLGEQAARRLFGELSEDKIKMGKITENFEKIREEFGDKAAPEIIRLHGAEAKPKPSQASTASTRVSSASAATRGVSPAPRLPTRPASSASRPSAAVSRTTNRAATQSTVAPTNRVPSRPATAPKRPNVVTATTAVRQSTPVRAPLSTRPTQSSTPRPFSAATKPSAAYPAPSARAPVRPVFAPNVVRASTNSSKPASTGPVKVISNSTSADAPNTKRLSEVQLKVTTGLPRSNSGLRPPTAILRTNGTGIPRLSRPSSPAK
ncbi:HEAT repeat protein [Cooperia oncophora]